MFALPTPARLSRVAVVVVVVAFFSKGALGLAFGKTSSTLLSRKSANPVGLPTSNEASRRDALTRLVGSAAIAVAPMPAVAAPPMATGEPDNVGASLERRMRPKPPKLLRSKLNQDFAVLLMRSSYNALDRLDCVPMDQFQRDFFLIRQAEYEPYVKSLGPGVVQQGDLKDPYYFDFISFAQYATVARDMKDPPEFFEEKQPEDMGEDEPMNFKPVVVKRQVDAKLLPEKYSEMVGEAILERLEYTFSGTTSAIPELKNRPDSARTLSALKQCCVLFVINGFAWDGSVEVVKEGSSNQSGSAAGTKFEVVFQSPANLWSGKALQLRRSVPTNDFFLKTARALLSRAGYSISSFAVKYENNQEVTTFSIS